MRILIVDDDAAWRHLVAEYVRKEHAVAEAQNGEQAMQMMSEHECAIVDQVLPDIDGAKLIEAMREGGYKGAIVAMSAHGTDTMVRELLLKAGADDYLAKGDGFRILILPTIAKACEARKLIEECCKGRVNE